MDTTDDWLGTSALPLHSLLSFLHVFLLYYKNPCPACSIQAYIQSLQSQSVKGSLYGAYFSAFAQLFTKHGRSSSSLLQHHPLPSFLNCSKTGPPISLKFGRSIRTGSPNIPSNFQAEIRSCPRETSRKSQYRWCRIVGVAYCTCASTVSWWESTLWPITSSGSELRASPCICSGLCVSLM